MVQFGTMIPSFELKLYEEMAKHIALVRQKEGVLIKKKCFDVKNCPFIFRNFKCLFTFVSIGLTSGWRMEPRPL